MRTNNFVTARPQSIVNGERYIICCVSSAPTAVCVCITLDKPNEWWFRLLSLSPLSLNPMCIAKGTAQHTFPNIGIYECLCVVVFGNACGRRIFGSSLNDEWEETKTSK